MIAGNWAANDRSFFYGAARRTIEGGRNLKDKYWATPKPSRPIGFGPTLFIKLIISY
jgi:hypothetical protein